MRRTYRSKKDVLGALDPRDVMFNMDERSSVFDAYYIQNIKQTKREFSCVAPSNYSRVASNKVRKRKYVKRILKEVETVRQRETMSSSAYLTPDKSIRVNKVLDPFDMLLNSSPSSQDAPKAIREKNIDKFVQKKESKTYTRKKKQRAKKINYSSTDSNSNESDKENTSDCQSNLTDIRTHELVVERQPSNSPKYLDESINKIVNNLSLINNYKCKGSNGSFNTSYKYNRNRPTKNFNSPILQRLPLCSTPFKEKYRGVSIFKFSPISQKEHSPNYEMKSKEKNGSDANIGEGKDLGPNISQEYQAPPLTHLPNSGINYKSDLLINEIEHHSNVQADISQSLMKHTDNEGEHSGTNIEQCSFQTTDTDPFLGFSNNSLTDITTEKICSLKSLEENKIVDFNEMEIVSMEYKDDSENHSKSSIASNKSNTSESSVDSQHSDRESLYDTCSSEQHSLVDDYKNNRSPIVAIERLSDSIFIKYYDKMQVDSQDEQMSEQLSDNDYFESLASDSKLEMLHNSLSNESDCAEIKPNEIVITDSSTTEDVTSNDEDVGSNEEEKCVSFVTTRRKNEITNDSMFIFDNSYGSSSTDCDKTVLSNIKVNLEKSEIDISLDNVSEPNLNNVNTYEEGNINKDFDLTESPSDRIYRLSNRKPSKFSRQSNSLSPVIKDSKLIDSAPDKRLSRITTRKSSRLTRKDNNVSPVNETNNLKLTGRKSDRIIPRKSTRKISKVLRESYSTSPELDASKNDVTLVDTNEANNSSCVVETNALGIDSNNLENKDAVSPSSLSPKNTSWISKERSMMYHPERSSYAGADVKPAIVLQPGKKWERSLSIYRRMTMADHYDQSILEDECFKKKGRKYRQSVISTMEMQESRDSLHNDSINSRRSTFISKPSRPTIRFVKDPNISRVSLSTSSIFDDLKGFLNEECDDTVIELSKLSIADSEHEVTILDNFHGPERVVTAQDYVLRRCNQTEPILFDECYPETVLKNCHKIGEGVYGEVFLWRGRDGRARVMKIVPIAGDIKVNGEDQKDFHEIISEIVIAMELSALRAPIADIVRQLDEGNDIHALDLHAIENATDTFNEVLAVRCVFGPYPSRLLDLWELYDECKGSENDSPAALPPSQRYVVLELANAGQDLESYQFASAQQAHALFQQIAFGLAVAEEAFQFEHRDLHWGNVLIAPTEQKLATFILRGRAYRVARRGVAATVIDYSLSRLSLPLAADAAALYNDLAADDQLFDAVGDYQFEVYRLMREKLGNEWKNFEPYTNILWLHYTVDKMITALRYKRTNTKLHKHYIEKLKGIKNRILEYGSAVQYVLTDIEL